LLGNVPLWHNWGFEGFRVDLGVETK